MAVLDRTRTPMGARRLRQWLLYPLLDERAIRARLDGVQELVENFSLREELKSGLDQVQDLERLAGRVAAGSALPRDLTAIKEYPCTPSISCAPDWQNVNAEALVSLHEKLSGLPEVVDIIHRAIVDDAAGGAQKRRFYPRRFRLPSSTRCAAYASHAKDWVANFEMAERRRTGIASLKVRYNRVFGYYIEVTRANLKAVPADYIRKQTLVNGERYITPELKEYEARVLNSQELIEKLEGQILARVREQVALHYGALNADQRRVGVAGCDSFVGGSGRVAAFHQAAGR